MDMKKKLEDTYKPDKQARKEKVVIGLSGGMDSLVTAYLLKIQKYELIAVTLLTSWEEYPGDQRQLLSCAINNEKLETLRELCHKLDITHHTIKLTSDFRERVIEPWMAEKILGRSSSPCWSCHDLRMSALYLKTLELGASKLATGHFAKLFHNDITHQVFVHSSNDEENDQSSLLSRLPHEVLQNLILPLSDLTKKEVVKLSENFGIDVTPRSVQTHHCLPRTPELNELVTKLIPAKFLSPGPVTNEEGNEKYGEHNGVHVHAVGDVIEYRDEGKPVRGVFSAYRYPEKRLVVNPLDYFLRDKFLLTNCHVSEGISLIEPFPAYAEFTDGTGADCWVYPKSLESVYLELSAKIKALDGQTCTLLRKKGKNSRVYLTGAVQLLPPEKMEEGEARVPKPVYSVDF